MPNAGDCGRAPRHVRGVVVARLIRRIYEVDPLVCTSCGGEMQILAFILDPAVVRKILDHLDDTCLPPAKAPPPSAAALS